MSMSLPERWAPLVTGGAPVVTVTSPTPEAAPDGETVPQMWVRRLYKRLVEQQRRVRFFDDYYSGNHPLPWLAPQAEEDFRRILAMTRTNYMGLVCDAQAERMIVEGFRVGDSREADAQAWRIWTENHQDADVDLGILEAAKSGASYLMVGPNVDDETLPLMSVEHPEQVTIALAPGHRRKALAALKVWVDEWTGRREAELHLPDYIVPASAKGGAHEGASPAWVMGDPMPNPLGFVGIFELPNNPQLLGGGRSELYDLTDIQDRINKTIADRLMTQDYGAFPQKWAKGYPDDAEPIRVGRDRMVTTSVSKQDAEFGQWEAAAVDPYSLAKREDVKDIASRSRTPAQYLLGEMSNVNGETLAASESGLVAKVRQRCRPIGEGLEDAMRAARWIAGQGTLQDSVRVIWRNPQFRTEGETVDALVKMSTLGVPLTALWEKWGATPEEIRRWEGMQEAQAARTADPALAALSRPLVRRDGDAPSDG